MTAIAGIWSFSGALDLQPAVSSMVAAQSCYGPHDQSVARLGDVAFGRALYRLLPEDRFDSQPLIDRSGRWMLAADARIDNREELLDALMLSREESLSDGALLLLAWERWREATLDRLLGDFAFAVWDIQDKSLTLVCDPAGQRPLHYHRGASFVAFASMPQGLHALPEIPRRLAHEQLAAVIADFRRQGSATFFEGIAKLEPGQALKIDPTRTQSRRYWQMPSREIRFANEADYFEAFREQFDRATRARLRGAGAVVGSHLSAGLDSSGVTATAARLIAPAGGRVTAFTSAPRLGFDAPVLAPRIADESSLAAEVAALYPNVEHVVVRSAGVSPLDLLGQDAELFQEPVGHACNIVWWSAVHDEARSRGISVMLTGETGNLTTSAGGLPMLAEFVRKGRWRRWWREARAVAGTGPSWRGVLATSFGPWTPKPIWQLLNRLVAKDPGVQGIPLLHPELRPAMEARAVSEARSVRLPADNRKFRWELLQQHSPGNFRKGILARWGIDERDPTADRRVADFCFSIPADILFSAGVTRRLARVAFADRLPASVLQAPRGYQYADWYEGISGESLQRTLADLQAGPAACLLDFDVLRHRVATWPQTDWHLSENIGTYRLAFLKALSVGSFANRIGGAGEVSHAQCALAEEGASG